jgi:cytochrome c
MRISQAVPAWSRYCASALMMLVATACDGSASTQADAAQAGADSGRGQRLLAQYQCGACHTIPGVQASRGIIGPSLADFGRRSYIAGHVPNRADLLAQWIADPRSLVPTTSMPNMGVSHDDARDMAAYLHTLR